MVIAVFSAAVSSYFMLGLLSTRAVTSQCNLNGINIEFYEDSECTNKITELNWKIMKEDDKVTKTLYLKNTGDMPVILNMKVSEYIPSDIRELISLSWDMEGLSLNPGESTPAQFSFSLNKLIKGIDEVGYNITVSNIN